MADYKFCPQCGSELIPGERFCGDCGFDTKEISGTAAEAQKESVEVDNTVSSKGDTVVIPKVDLYAEGNTSVGGSGSAAPPYGAYENQKMKGQANSKEPSLNNHESKRALVIVIIILAVAFGVGGGLYWWFSREKNPTGNVSTQQNTEQTTQQGTSENTGKTTNQNTGQSTSGSQNNGTTTKPDLSRAATYLPKAGLKCTFYVNYPDGASGTMERISAKVVPNEAVLMSEVEIIQEQGEAMGFSTHYVERADGTYLIYDNTPMEIFPVLKNNLIVGQTWEYKDENGSIVWKVAEVGVTLNLGFTTVPNCLMVEENNQAVGVKTINYFAPGMGKIMQKSSQKGQEYLKLNGFSTIGTAEAEAAVKKWAPNYSGIKDDRTQQ